MCLSAVLAVTGRRVLVLVWLGAMGVVATLFALRWLVRRVGVACGFCGRRLSPFDELLPKDQDTILLDYRARDGREPPTAGLRVCVRCRAVYDDSSDVRKGYEGDMFLRCRSCGDFAEPLSWFKSPVAQARVRRANPGVAELEVCRACPRLGAGYNECLVCDHTVYVCRRCFAAHAWKTSPRSPYRYFTRLSGTETPDAAAELRPIPHGDPAP